MKKDGSCTSSKNEPENERGEAKQRTSRGKQASGSERTSGGKQASGGERTLNSRQALESKQASKESDKKSPIKEKQREPFARAANEDDDGYDPWSDRIIQEPLWENDPWN